MSPETINCTQELTANLRSKIKLELTYDDIMKRSKVYPGGKHLLSDTIKLLKLGMELPGNKFKRFYDKDLSLTDSIRLAHKIKEIKSLPSIIPGVTEYMDVTITHSTAYIKHEVGFTPFTLYYSDFSKTNANHTAFSFLNKIGFCFWWEIPTLEYIIDEDCESPDEEHKNTQRLARKWQKQTPTVLRIKQQPEYHVLYKALGDMKLQPEQRIWYAMILFLDQLNISIMDMSFRDDEDGGESIYIEDSLQIHLDHDEVSEQINTFYEGGYSWFRGLMYSRAYEYNDDEVYMSFDNIDLYAWKIHEFVEMIFHFKNWFWMNPKKEYKDGYLNSLKYCVQTMQSYLHIPVEFTGIDLRRDFECCKRKVRRLQNAYYKRHSKNDERASNVSN